MLKQTMFWLLIADMISKQCEMNIKFKKILNNLVMFLFIRTTIQIRPGSCCEQARAIRLN